MEIDLFHSIFVQSFYSTQTSIAYNLIDNQYFCIFLYNFYIWFNFSLKINSLKFINYFVH